MKTLRQHLAIVGVSYSRDYGVVLQMESIRNLFFLIIEKHILVHSNKEKRQKQNTFIYIYRTSQHTDLETGEKK